MKIKKKKAEDDAAAWLRSIALVVDATRIARFKMHIIEVKGGA